MLVAFLQALVNMLNKEIERMELPPALQPTLEAAETPAVEPPPTPDQLP
jgi:hypothetical protein